ncbi:hypothetical protein BS47DRAFT_1369460 [Hydnum rufescens UP504]|uniref:Uncharacterized protein n=1 Tax=Hydnum rufescens UP504 TaxID=1448309 RepID=A0A9P6DLT5_9AGAM|nr:hypothetical protein BS47DRAFT_1369460 [Hydnum rufescens UP504]
MPNEYMNHAPLVEGYRLNHLPNEPPLNTTCQMKSGNENAQRRAAGTPDEPHPSNLLRRVCGNFKTGDPAEQTHENGNPLPKQNPQMATLHETTKTPDKLHTCISSMIAQKEQSHTPQPAPTANQKPATPPSENTRPRFDFVNPQLAKAYADYAGAVQQI